MGSIVGVLKTTGPVAKKGQQFRCITELPLLASAQSLDDPREVAGVIVPNIEAQGDVHELVGSAA